MIYLAAAALLSEQAARLPGFGVVTPADRCAWASALEMLPSSIARDPNSQFCNPKLATILEDFLKQHCLELKVPRLSEQQYVELLEQDLKPQRVAAYLSRINTIIQLREDNPYHGGYHSRSEVPQRIQTILKNLNQDEIVKGSLAKAFSRAILFAAAPTHDLFHAGVGYAQRLTPGINISNEERAVIKMVDIAFDAGLNALQILEMQRIILPTSFYQKANQLGINRPFPERIKYLTLDGLPEHTFSKAVLAREYDPDVSAFAPTKKMAQVLALADVCVTLGSFEKWIDRSVAYYIEVKVGQGNYPRSVQELIVVENQFLHEHLNKRLQACRPFLNRDFYNTLAAAGLEFSQRLESAGKNPNSSDGKLLADAVDKIANYHVTSGPNLEGLLDF